MARILAQVEYKQALPALSYAELNDAYSRLEERYNYLRSNWEWFKGTVYNPFEAALERVDQN